jgi:membrane fusion protein (multidrug efflux system)
VDRVSAEVSATCRNDDHGYGHDMIGDELIPDGGSAAAVNAAVINTQRRWTGRARLRAWLLLGGLAVLLLGALLVWLGGGRTESTDNAYFQTGLVAVAANVSGPGRGDRGPRQSARQRKGQVLFRIDPAPYPGERSTQRRPPSPMPASRSAALPRRCPDEGEAQSAAAQRELDYADEARPRARNSLLAEGISSQAQYDQALLAAADGAAGHPVEQRAEDREHRARPCPATASDADRRSAVREARAGAARPRAARPRLHDRSAPRRTAW